MNKEITEIKVLLMQLLGKVEALEKAQPPAPSSDPSPKPLDPHPTEDTALTFAALSAKVIGLIHKGQRPAVKELFAKYKASNLQELDPRYYETVAHQLDELATDPGVTE